MRMSSAAKRLADAAHMSGVCPHAPSRVSTDAPLSSSAVTVAESPLDAAKCNALAAPVVVMAFTFAPADNNAFTTVERPLRAARCSGV